MRRIARNLLLLSLLTCGGLYANALTSVQNAPVRVCCSFCIGGVCFGCFPC